MTEYLHTCMSCVSFMYICVCIMYIYIYTYTHVYIFRTYIQYAYSKPNGALSFLATRLGGLALPGPDEWPNSANLNYYADSRARAELASGWLWVE